MKIFSSQLERKLNNIWLKFKEAESCNDIVNMEKYYNQMQGFQIALDSIKAGNKKFKNKDKDKFIIYLCIFCFSIAFLFIENIFYVFSPLSIIFGIIAIISFLTLCYFGTNCLIKNMCD